MKRKALVVGIDNYEQCPLTCCCNDAKTIAELLRKNENGDPNFEVLELCNINMKSELRSNIEKCFDGDVDVALFYFSGHGFIDDLGGYLVTPDYKDKDWGVSLQDVLAIVNNSKIKNKIVIVDSCHSGFLGQINLMGNSCSIIENGVTILTACKSDEVAIEGEKEKHGIFTTLLIEALNGAAADILGRITTASIYAYIDSNLGAWEQRPIFKTNISNFISVRDVKPRVEKEVLRETMQYFEMNDYSCQLDPSFEYTNNPEYKFEYVKPYADKINTKKFKNLQKLVSVGLVVPEDEEHMYFAAMNSKRCKLTNIGKYYFKLVKNGKI